MQQAGYETFMAGKWHLDRLASTGEVFQQTRNIRPGMPSAAEEGYDRPGEGNLWSPSDKAWGGHWTGGKHWSEVLADDAEFFIDQASQSEKPFFMYLAFNAPHDPRQSPQQFVDRYPPESISVPSDFLPEYPYKQEMGCYETGTKEGSKILRDERLAPWPRTPEAIRLHRQEYYAIVTHMDEQVGRIVRALEESQQDENTYIIFTSDHGLACGHHGLMGKQNMYDHSVRVPLMVVGPDVPAGAQVSASVYLQDIVPTTLELAGIETPQELDFQSLRGLIQGESDSRGNETMYGCYMPTLQRMVRNDQYKLIVYPQVPVLRLFDLVADLAEQRDLAQDAAHRDTVRRLFHKLQILQEELDDPLKLDAAEYDL
jgi:choline-sulfatase